MATGTELDELQGQLALLHPPHNTFPGDVLLDLAADASKRRARLGSSPIEFEQICQRYLPECPRLTKAEHHKSKYATRAAAMIRAGVDPGLLDEVGWWRTDDLWVWAPRACRVFARRR